MSYDTLVVVLIAIAVTGFLALLAKPRQIESAVRQALIPLSEQFAALERRIAQQEIRSERTETTTRALESEVSRRMQDLLLSIARMEGAMSTRADNERLHRRIDELSQELHEALAANAEFRAEAAQAIKRVERVEQHLMEKDR